MLSCMWRFKSSALNVPLTGCVLQLSALVRAYVAQATPLVEAARQQPKGAAAQQLWVRAWLCVHASLCMQERARAHACMRAHERAILVLVANEAATPPDCCCQQRQANALAAVQALTQDVCGLGASMSIVENHALMNTIVHQDIPSGAMEAQLVQLGPCI